MQKLSPLAGASDLSEWLGKENLVLIDARTGADAKEKYSAGHLKGALFVDLETELSHKSSNAANGGRHPLPAVKDFAALLGRLGIDPSTQVIVYDDKHGANAAARFWWMMKAVGHEAVQVLDGSLKAATDAGLLLTTEVSTIKSKPAYPAEQWLMPTVTADEVAAAVSKTRTMVIDVREGYRYRGESEPIDTVAGHIPGAVNIPYIENLDAGGQFLPASELAKKYQAAMGERKAEDVIVHCGSGVTACHTLLAMEQAGIRGAQLYVGSWSEWSRSGRTVATGDN
jgi:thiosulfate/3-mercaptopyruvate sulfurtransferase